MSIQSIISSAIDAGLKKMLVTYGSFLVEKLSEIYGFDSADALANLDIDNFLQKTKNTDTKSKDTKSKDTKKEPKSKEKHITPAFYLPYCNSIIPEWCGAVRCNGGLFNQCTSLHEAGELLCKGCDKTVSAETGKPRFGLISERSQKGWSSPSGKVTHHYTKIMLRENITRAQAEAEASKFGWTIPEDQFDEPVSRKGRVATKEKTTKVAEDKSKSRGRPRKDKKTVSGEEEPDMIAELLAQAKKSVLSDEEVSDEEQESESESEYESGSGSGSGSVSDLTSVSDEEPEIVSVPAAVVVPVELMSDEEPELAWPAAVAAPVDMVCDLTSDIVSVHAAVAAPVEMKSDLTFDPEIVSPESEKAAKKAAKKAKKAQTTESVSPESVSPESEKAAKKAKKAQTTESVSPESVLPESEKAAKKAAKKAKKAQTTESVLPESVSPESVSPESEKAVKKAKKAQTTESVPEREEVDSEEVLETVVRKYLYQGVTYLKDCDGILFDLSMEMNEVGMVELGINGEKDKVVLHNH
jgi:hypothetical protein